MVITCSVHNCDSGRRPRHPGNTNKSFFQCNNTSGDRFLKWQKIFEGTNTRISAKSYICEKHFYSSDILTEKVIRDRTGKVIFHMNYKLRKLKENAVPIFVIYDEITSQWMSQNAMYDTIEYLKTEDNPECTGNSLEYTGNNLEYTGNNLEYTGNNLEDTGNNLEYAGNNLEYFDNEDNKECIADLVGEISKNCGDDVFNNSNNGCITNETIFEKLSKENINGLLPDLSWGVHKNVSNKYIMFSQLAIERSQAGNAPKISKKVLVHEDGQTEVYFLNKSIITEDIPQIVKSINQVEQLLQTVHNLNICVGGPSAKMYSSVTKSRSCYKDNIYYKWRHTLCPVYIQNGVICRKCATIDDVLRKHIVVDKLHAKHKREQYNQAKSLKRAKKKLEDFISANQIDWVDMVEADS